MYQTRAADATAQIIPMRFQAYKISRGRGVAISALFITIQDPLQGVQFPAVFNAGYHSSAAPIHCFGGITRMSSIALSSNSSSTARTRGLSRASFMMARL